MEWDIKSLMKNTTSNMSVLRDLPMLLILNTSANKFLCSIGKICLKLGILTINLERLYGNQGGIVDMVFSNFPQIHKITRMWLYRQVKEFSYFVLEIIFRYTFSQCKKASHNFSTRPPCPPPTPAWCKWSMRASSLSQLRE